jgi:hypothetical protein
LNCCQRLWHYPNSMGRVWSGGQVSDVNVAVRKAGRIIDHILRPVRETVGGPAVTYRRQLWPLSNNSIDLDASPIPAGSTDNSSPKRGPDVPSTSNRTDPVATNATRHSESIAPELLEDFVDEGQTALLALSSHARILVDAPPGTGKTHVACQRVAALIRDGANPSRIWIISFTRTAVFEIRNRIASALETADAASVRIATLDSHAWSMQSGFSPDATLTGGHDKGIEETLRLLREDTQLAEYLQRLDHLVIDEGQDIVGPRAKLTLAFVDAVAPECGITVFADEAQAIYEFSEEESERPTGSTLLEELKAKGFDSLGLTHVYRTQNPKLRNVFIETRKHVLDRSMCVQKRAGLVRDDIIRMANANVGSISQLNLADIPRDSLVLMRRRADVLERSARNGEMPHRLRMSGLPPRLRPWLAAMFCDFCERLVSRHSFDKLWEERVSGTVAEGAPSAQVAWNLLLEVGGHDAQTIDISRVREILSRTNPPVLFCSPDFGDEGPILGTIHASKGREATDVHLYLPPAGQAFDESDEEIRVMFVGATRARERLSVGESNPQYARSTPSRRVWRRTRSGRVQFEVGRRDDVCASGLVGRSAFSSQGAAMNAQLSWHGTPVCSGLHAKKEESLQWHYSILNQQAKRLAVLDESFDADLREIAQALKTWRTPSVLPHLRSLGIRSIVLRPDDPILEDLYEPWRSSGFLFAPLLTGFTTGKFG